MTIKDDLPNVIYCDEEAYHRWIRSPKPEDVEHFFATTPEELEAREAAYWEALCENIWATTFRRTNCVRVSRFKEGEV